MHTHAHVDHVTGETNYFSDAGMIYEKWYENFIDTVLTQDLKDDTGTLNRFGDTVLKVAMLLALHAVPRTLHRYGQYGTCYTVLVRS